MRIPTPLRLDRQSVRPVFRARGPQPSGGSASLHALVALAFLAAGTPAAEYAAYVMGYFKESPTGKANSPTLHLAVSADGLNWLPLNQNKTVLKPAMGTGALRDPFFYRMPDGSFTIVATDNWNSQYIHIWSSPDLRTFTNERLVQMNNTGMHAWAPEVFYDANRKQYAIIWSGNTDRNRIYVNYTSDFKTVTSPQVFFDPGFSVIDGHMEVGVGGSNYLYYKNERDFKLYGTKSPTLEPRSFDAGTYTTGYGAPFTGSHTEATILVKSLYSGTWWLWGDSYIPVNAVFYAWKTTDLARNSWTPVDRRDYTPPPNAKHGTITPITKVELDALVAKWGRPDFEVLKSYRIPTAYVRHAGNVGKVSTYPFEPVEDMYWKVVPGLADPSGISLQSANTPNAYLRQANSVVSMAVDDNTPSFRSGATFFKVPGFANGAWTSLRSHAMPDRYLRKADDSTLRLDAISATSSAADKEDATFKLVHSGIDLASVSVEREAASARMSRTPRFQISQGPGGVSSLRLEFATSPGGDCVVEMRRLDGGSPRVLHEGPVASAMDFPLERFHGARIVQVRSSGRILASGIVLAP